jgi:predicted metal-dependent hydrolase
MPDLHAWLKRADELCAKGEYFEAHEELEAGWMKASGLEKTVLQGAVQVCAGLHRLRTRPEKTDGAFYLFERGLQKLSKGKELLAEGAVERLEEALTELKRAKKAPASFALRLA